MTAAEILEQETKVWILKEVTSVQMNLRPVEHFFPHFLTVLLCVHQGMTKAVFLTSG